MFMAATGGAQAEASAGGRDVWDEARLEESMRRLKLLHIKIKGLSDAITKILEPFAAQHSNPTSMYNAFNQAVTESQQSIREFTDLMNEVKSQQVFARAIKSREENAEGIEPWSPQDHPDWFHMDPKQEY